MKDGARRRAVMVLGALSLVAAACGTRVDGAEQALQAGEGDLSDDGFTITAPDDESDGDASTQTSAATGGETASGSSGGGQAGTGTPSGGAGTATSTPGASNTTVATTPPGGGGEAPGPGVTDSTIKVGVVRNVATEDLNALQGFAIEQPDYDKALELIVEDINARGGVAGRTLEVEVFEFNALSGKSGEQIQQEGCAHFTQDTEVFAVMVHGSDTLKACLTAAGVVQVGGGGGINYSDTYNRFPYFVDIGVPSLDRLAVTYVNSLHAQGFYDEARPNATALGGIKVGLISYDMPVYEASGAVLEQTLNSHGIELADEIYIKPVETYDDIATQETEIRSAALRFKEQGITHVQFLMESGGGGQLKFYENADNFNYEPRYGFTSIDLPQALISVFESDKAGGPSRQFDMALGIGWVPLRDVPREDYSGDAETAALRRCKQITEPASGGGFNDPVRNKEMIVGNLCDTFYYFQAAMNAGGPVPNTASWLRGVSTITAMEGAFTWMMRTDNGRDAPAHMRHYAFFQDCTCFHYTSGPKDL